MSTNPLDYKTKKTFNDSGHAHELTFSTMGRQPLLIEPGVPEIVLRYLRRSCDEHRFDLWAFVVMPEHCHVLVNSQNENYSISSLLNGIKSPSAQKALELHPRLRNLTRVKRGKSYEYQFWLPGGGFDRNVVDAAAAWQMIEYIHWNPVKRGLVDAPGCWPWSSAAAYERGFVPGVTKCPWEL